MINQPGLHNIVNPLTPRGFDRILTFDPDNLDPFASYEVNSTLWVPCKVATTERFHTWKLERLVVGTMASGFHLRDEKTRERIDSSLRYRIAEALAESVPLVLTVKKVSP